MDGNVVYIKDAEGKERRFEILLQYEHDDQSEYWIVQDPDDEGSCYLLHVNDTDLEFVEDEKELANAEEILDALTGEDEEDA